MADWNDPEYAEASSNENHKGTPVSPTLPILGTRLKYPVEITRVNATRIIAAVGPQGAEWIRENYPNMEESWIKPLAAEIRRQDQDGGIKAALHIFLRVPHRNRGYHYHEEPFPSDGISDWACADMDIRVDTRNAQELEAALASGKHTTVTCRPDEIHPWVELAQQHGARIRISDHVSTTEGEDIVSIYQHLRATGVDIPSVTTRALLQGDNPYHRRLASENARIAVRTCRAWIRQQRALTADIVATYS
jgi:hypothetical protein